MTLQVPPTSRPLRVLTVGSVPPEHGGETQGGVATFHATLIQELGRRPQDHDLLLVGVLAANATEPRGLPVASVGRRAEERPRDYYTRLLDETRPDVVLFNHLGHAWGLLHVREHATVPSVAIVHSWNPITFASPANRAAAAARAQEVADGMCSLVFPSEHCRAEGLELGFRYSCDTSVIPCPLPHEYLSVDEGSLSLPRAGITFVGSLIERKNPLALAQAVDDETVTFAGEGSERTRVEALGKPGMNLLGSLTMSAVRDLLLTSEVMCLPSSSESFGIAYIEAMACGTPVVGFRGTLQEIFESVGPFGRTVSDASPGTLREALRHVRSSSWDRDAMRRSVQSTYSPSRIAATYADLLHSVADGATRARC